MKRNIKFSALLLLIAGLIQISCTRDPYEDVHSNEKSIEEVTLSGGATQIGPAVIDRAAGKATVYYLALPETDLSKVVTNIQTSYRGTVSPASGQTVDFVAGNNKSTFTVTAESGEKREWTLEVVPFNETLQGTFAIQNFTLYGGCRPEWGGSELYDFSAKPWLWTEDGYNKELDNVLTFTVTGATEDGKITGTVSNSAGADGAYANFFFAPDGGHDVNNWYRTLPKGEGTWVRDYGKNTVTFTFDGKTSVATFEEPKVLQFENGKWKKTITDNSLSFQVAGDVTNETGMFTDYNKVVLAPRNFWIDLKKQ